jgi:hypothetical protein
LILGIEHSDRAEEVRQQAAAVDVADQNDGNVGSPGQAHVGQIGCAQVDLGRRAGALADDRIEFFSQRAEFVGDNGGQPVSMLEVIAGAQRVDDLAAQHQL